MAVGSRDQVQGFGGKAIAEVFAHGKWRVSSGVGLAGYLVAVFCGSTHFCLAVGSISWNTTLVEAWNGTRWTREKSPSAPGSELNSVACLKVTDCWAVGDDKRGTLIEHWNGSAWSVNPSPKPPHADLPQLDGVACPSETACMAVGDYVSNLVFTSETLAEQWVGHGWRIVKTMNEPGGHLNSVACPTRQECMAVGDHNGPALIERWNGSVWSIAGSRLVKGQL